MANFDDELFYGTYDHDGDGDVDLNDVDDQEYIDSQEEQMDRRRQERFDDYDDYDDLDEDSDEDDFYADEQDEDTQDEDYTDDEDCYDTNDDDDDDYDCENSDEVDFCDYIDEENEDCDEYDQFEDQLNELFHNNISGENSKQAVDEINVAKDDNKQQDNFKNIDLKRYYDYGDYYVFNALLDNFPKLKKEYRGNESLNCKDVIIEIAKIDIKDAITYWKWVMDTFTVNILNFKGLRGKTEAKYNAFYMGGRILESLLDINPIEALEVIKQPYYFDYIFKYAKWLKFCADDGTIDHILIKVYLNDFDLFDNIYNCYLKYQKSSYTKRELCVMWSDFLSLMPYYDDEYEDCDKDRRLKILSYIEEKCANLGYFSKGILNDIKNEKQEILEEQRQEQLIKQQEIKKTKREDFIISEYRKRVAIMSNNAIYNEEYKKQDRNFNFYYKKSNRVCDVATDIVLNDCEIKRVDGLQMATIHSSNIEKIAFICCLDFRIVCYIRYKIKEGHDDENSLKLFKLNKPIYEFALKYCYKFNFLYYYLLGLNFRLSKENEKYLLENFHYYKDWEKEIIEKSKTLFNNETAKGKVIVGWVQEKRLFAYAQLNYYDAVFKYEPEWGEGLFFDVYIKSLNLIIEYKVSLKQNAQQIEIDEYNVKIEKFNKKRRLCQQNGIEFIEWSQDLPINEQTFLNVINNFLAKKVE